MHSRKYHLGIILAISGSLLFSTKAIFVKLAYLEGADSITLLLMRMLYALPFYLAVLWILFLRKKLRLRMIKKRHWAGLLFSGILGYYLSSLFDFLGLQYIPASLERIILFIYPTFIVILASVFFKEKISSSQIKAIALSYLGLLILFSPNLINFGISPPHLWKGIGFILVCALTFATFFIINQWLIPHFGVIALTSLSMIVACLAVLIHFGITNTLDQLAVQPRIVHIYAISMAFVATVIPSYVVNYAIAWIGASRSAILSSIGPISTITLAYIFLGERLVPAQIIGAIMVIFGVTIISVERNKLKDQKRLST